MPLDKQKLEDALKKTFKDAYDKNSSGDEVAAALANAIDAYVRGAAVKGVTVEVRNTSNAIIGSGTQNNTGKLE